MRPGAISFEELRHHPAASDENEMSLADMQQIASDYGFESTPCRIDLDALNRLDVPFACIAHEEPFHFVLVSKVKDRLVELIDPPIERSMDREAFERLFKGDYLLVSTEPITFASRVSSRWIIVLACLSLLLVVARLIWGNVLRTRR